MTTCPVLLQSSDRFDAWHPRTCGRPVAEGAEKCSMHIKTDERRAAKLAKEREGYSLDRERERDATRRVNALHELLSVTSGAAPQWRPGYGSNPGRYTGGITLTPEVTDRVIELLSGLRPEA
jgi:hypothetical protein